MANGHMAGHRRQQPGPGSPLSRSRACSSWDHALPAPPPGALDEDRRISGTVPVPGTRSVDQGHHPHDEIRVPAPAGSSPDVKRDTPGRFPGYRCRCRYGWSWPAPPAGTTPHQRQEPRALARTGACGQPGSRTANRMAVPSSPSIRERACPARLRPARTARTTTETGRRANWPWRCTAASTGPRTCDTRSHGASELAGWRADDVGGIASGQCSRPVPALTCAAGNCGVRSSGKKPKRSRSIRERRRGEDRTGERE